MAVEGPGMNAQALGGQARFSRAFHSNSIEWQAGSRYHVVVRTLFLAALACLSTGCSAMPSPSSAGDFHAWAPTPPMGWNSWDCWGTGVTEEQTKANADFMAAHLAKHGWQYVTVDIQWYEPNAKTLAYRKDAHLTLDANGRLLPAVNRFPSAAEGKGFEALADYVHGKGLKFGIHLLRGIPRQAVQENSPILGTPYRAADVANTKDTCPWNPDMYGVDMSKPGAQAYYDSVFALIASWGVDFVKVDDLSRPYLEHEREIEAIRVAMDRSGRAMVLSTSPGETPLAAAGHVAAHANMWRISDDFWDSWKALKEQFERCANWAAKPRVAGAWPDADMIPLARVRAWENGWSHFSQPEAYTLMSLWCIARSPLIFGGHLPDTDAFTLTLLTNDEALAVNQRSANNRQLYRHDDLIAWTADVPGSGDKYVALFNASASGKPETLTVRFADLGLPGRCGVRDLWSHEDLGTFEGSFGKLLPMHGAGLYRVSR